MRRAALVALLLAAFVANWAWFTSPGSVDDLLVASPGDTLQAFSDDWTLLTDNRDRGVIAS